MSNVGSRHTRRRFIKLGGLAGATALAGCTGGILGGDSGLNGSGEWPMFQYDAANTGNAQVAKPDGGVSLDWSFDTEDAVRHPPVVHDGVVYARGIVAVSIEDGSELWDEPIGGTSMATTDEYLYTAHNRAGRDDGLLKIHSRDDGTQLAQYPIPGYESAALSIIDGTVYVSSNRATSTANEHHVDVEKMYALTAQGGVQWSYDLQQPAAFGEGSYWRSLSPVIEDGTVYTATHTGEDVETETVAALSRQNGSEEWTTGIPNEPCAPMSVADGTLYVPIRGEDGCKLLALSTADGSEQWRFETDHDVLSSVAVTSDRACLVGRTGDEDTTAYGLSVDAGDERWTYEKEHRFYWPPVIVDSTVYVTGETFKKHGRIHAVDVADGSEEWVAKTDEHVNTSPVICQGRILVGSDENKLLAFD
jgi:outer membrane protein assembly factor BamB